MAHAELRVQQITYGSAGEARRCESPGCSRATREGKPFCPEHVTSHPYVQELERTLEAQRVEQARVRKRGARAVDPAGLTAEEIVRQIRVQGPRSVRALAREMALDPRTTRAYVDALVERGVLRLEPARRSPRVWLVEPEAASSTARGAA